MRLTDLILITISVVSLAVAIDARRQVHQERRYNAERERDFDLLLSPPDPSAMPEDEARELAARLVQEVRAGKRTTSSA